eukprot:CAMPEP_0182908884 /NCGR_PEP_ID=MMETSP0034_2-20130328/35451_1 /TAXON_ID=156128 /ORGANISM="Nephroselmis pyriformis, Strain CCMP717" /LENGTH=56 /DNA_ID=CAMNT_0025045091 /DNA_START=206 /DNA_END=372 /DNA_ORIENTATION=+
MRWLLPDGLDILLGAFGEVGELLLIPPTSKPAAVKDPSQLAHSPDSVKPPPYQILP